jgi:hypothetical protein
MNELLPILLLTERHNMNINTRKLRIKAKHLAEEARIIRREAQRVHGMDRWQLNHHRQTTVRDEARATQLAYQFLRGKHPYHALEATVNDPGKLHSCILPRVRAMVQKYGEPGDANRLSAWITGEPKEVMHWILKKSLNKINTANVL